MTPLLKRLLTIILIICTGTTVIIFFNSNTEEITSDINKPLSPAIKVLDIDKSESVNRQDVLIQKQGTLFQKKSIPEGVNTVFHDKPKRQIAWMERGKNVVIKNKPDADAADFRNTFFHRGAKARPVTCGEVQFRSEGAVINGYQRFIYTGIQSSYLEHDVVNFDIFWSIMCEQTLDEYFEL